MKHASILFVFLMLSGCTMISGVTKTNCTAKLNGVNPYLTAIRVNEDVELYSKKSSKYTVLKKGYYYPSVQAKGCEYIAYIGEEKIQINYTNKWSNFWDKGKYPGGIEIKVDKPNSIHSVWYFKSGVGYDGLELKNASDIDFDILYQNPNSLE